MTFKDPYMLQYADSHNLWIRFMHIPTKQKAKFFAIVTDIGDNFTSNWNDEDVYGRMDPISTFQNTRRSISLAFSLFSECSDDALENMKELDSLIQMHYPVYNSDLIEGKSARNRDLPDNDSDKRNSDRAKEGEMRNVPRISGDSSTITASPLLRVQFSNWLMDNRINHLSKDGSSGIVCKSNGIGVKPNIDMGAFELGIEGLFWKQIDISMELTPFHTHPLGFGTNGRPRKYFGRFPYGQI